MSRILEGGFCSAEVRDCLLPVSVGICCEQRIGFHLAAFIGTNLCFLVYLSFDVTEVTSLYRINSYLVGKSETSAKCLKNIQGQVQAYATVGMFNSRAHIFTWSITCRCLRCLFDSQHDFRRSVYTVSLKNGSDTKIATSVNITYLITVYKKRKILAWVHEVQVFGWNRVRAMHWAYIYICRHMISNVHILNVRKHTQCTCTLTAGNVIYPLYDVASLSFDVTGLAVRFAKNVQEYNNFCMP